MFTVQLKKLDPAMLQTPKKEKREYWKRKNEEYRNEINSDFNLLRKWVPGTKNLTRRQLLKKTVNYIQELLNKINEKESPMECTPLTLTGMGRNSVPKITVHHYAKEQDSALREPQTSPTDTSGDLRTGPSPTDHSVILESLRNKILDKGASEAESDILKNQESLLPEEFPEFNTVEDLREWLGIDDMTPSEDPSPEFNTVEDLTEWLGIDDMTPSEDLSPEEEMKLLEIPEFNWTEDLRQYIEL
jgi:transposase